MVQAYSRAITSNQLSQHEQIPQQVAKYWQQPFLKPIAIHSQAAFASVNQQVQQFSGPIILDACCGVGESTAELARRNPHALVIGVDKSAHRLAKHVQYQQQDNAQYLLVRADLNDFWRLAAAANWPVQQQCIFYPNPWPKKKHLGRRWHGAPVFPALVQLGGALEMRSNWPLYLQEFATALACVGISSEVQPLTVTTHPITPFERKYQASGQQLWQLTATLANAELLAAPKLAQLSAQLLENSTIAAQN